MKKRTVLTPSYYKNFQCIGSACEDTCCKGWGIAIDKKIYKKLKNHSKLNKLIHNKITRNRRNPTDYTYAKIKLNENKECSFLTDQYLCGIQLEYGEDYLSDTCVFYPRMFSEVNGQLEISLTLSCPEVARVALLDPDIMEFDEGIKEFDIQRQIPVIKVDERKTSIKEDKYFWELRIFTIEVLQSREYELWQRLMILGLFYKEIHQHINQNLVHNIPNAIKKYTIMLKEASLKDSLENISLKTTLQMELLKGLTDERLFLGVNNESFKKCYAEFLLGVSYDVNDTVENIGNRYLKCYEDYYLPFMREREYILENYLVNYVFKQLFPLTKGKTYFESYIMMIIHYGLIKMLLIGRAGVHKKNLNEEHIVELIYSLSRAVEHDNKFIQHVFDLIKNNDMDTMAYMAILIKN